MHTALKVALAYNGDRYQVFTAPIFQSALLQLAIVLPHLIILHVESPQGAGYESLRRFRDLSTVPIIAIADGDCPELGIPLLHEGADVWLFKLVARREL